MDLPENARRAIEQLNDRFVSERTLPAKLEAVAQMIHALVPGCDAASISLTVEEATITGASTSQMAIEADLVQYRTSEGPCLDAAAEQAVIRIDVLAHDERYEHFAPGAIEAGVESVLSLPLVADGRTVGSINLYSRTPRAFTDDDPTRVSDHMTYAARLIADSPLYAASTDALTHLIEADHTAAQVAMAIGMLSISHGYSSSEAWDHLVVLGDRDGSSIVECARRLISEHEGKVGRRHRSSEEERS